MGLILLLPKFFSVFYFFFLLEKVNKCRKKITGQKNEERSDFFCLGLSSDSIKIW